MKRFLRFLLSIHSFYILFVSPLAACSSSEDGVVPQDAPHYQSGPCTAPGLTEENGPIDCTKERVAARPAPRDPYRDERSSCVSARRLPGGPPRRCAVRG